MFKEEIVVQGKPIALKLNTHYTLEFSLKRTDEFMPIDWGTITELDLLMHLTGPDFDIVPKTKCIALHKDTGTGPHMHTITPLKPGICKIVVSIHHPTTHVLLQEYETMLLVDK